MKTKWILSISICLNIIFVLMYLLHMFNSPSQKLGKLKQDVKVGFFGGDSTFIYLPKGITVKDKSERGIAAIGQFENNRFEIIITSNKDLVDYNLPKDSLFLFQNFYSADIND